MTSANDVTAAIIIIGDEILSGRTVECNAHFITTALNDIGVEVREVRIIPDQEETIVRTVNRLRCEHNYVFTTGGIGPTHDDITADSVAKAFDAPIDVDPRAVDLMLGKHEPQELTPERLRMARIPTGARLIENSVSIAPGFIMENVYVMAGIPKVMQAMLRAALPDLQHGETYSAVHIKVHIVESEISAPLRAIQESHPDVKIGSYPFFEANSRGANLVLRSRNQKNLTQAQQSVADMLSLRQIFFEVDE